MAKFKTFKITVKDINEKITDESEVFEWKTIPRIGEIVRLGDAQQPFRFSVKNVVHYFRRGMNSDEGEICLEVENEYKK
ncbi:MAG: hypothetical protein ABSD57_14940 [Verrucomicrobiota bacterium]|jgi:hypothetical protein